MSRKSQPQKGALTPEQANAAAYLAIGRSQLDTAEAIGVSRSTIQRWVAYPAFEALYTKLKLEHKKAFTSVVVDDAKARAQLLNNQLREYQETRSLVSNMQLDVVQSLLTKLANRIDDLPDEAIQPAQIGSLLSAISSVSEKAFDGWADVVGIRETQEQISMIAEGMAVEEGPRQIEAEEVEDSDEGDVFEQAS